MRADGGMVGEEKAMKWFGIIILALALFGCANSLKHRMDSQIGIMTYEQALVEFGPPDKMETSGKTKAAKWFQWKGELHYTYILVFDENNKMIKWKQTLGWL